MRRPPEEIDFHDATRASFSLARFVDALPVECQDRILSLLAASANPDDALHFLERLHAERPAEFRAIAETGAGLQLLAAVFSHSRFLAEAVLLNPEWVLELAAGGALDRLFLAEDYRKALAKTLTAEPGPPSPHTLALFRRRQLLRILLRDVTGLADLPEITDELSSLADAIMGGCYGRIRDDLAVRHGLPSDPRFAVLSLGKLGGRELNYSSDIDLMFLYAENGMTAGAAPISSKEFFKKAANQLTDLLSTYTAAGVTYRVDLRLRPDGRFGEVIVSLDGAKRYYRERARDWELQMLVKARVSAGDAALGAELLDAVEPLIYSSTLDFSVVEAASETRVRIREKMAARRGGPQGFNIKLAPGGIRDIEFLVQCLQRLHGGREPWVRHAGTLLALSRLRDKNLLSPIEYAGLAGAYQFLRHLEHRLQFHDDRQTHTLPKDADELAALARKMPGAHFGAQPTADSLLGELNYRLETVQEIYERVIHAQQPVYYATASAPAASGDGAAEVEEPYEHGASNLVRFLDQRAPQLAAAVARSGLRRGRVHFEHLLERILPHAEWMGWLDSDSVLASYVLDIVEHSPYFAEQLIRSPELLAELRNLRREPEPEPSYLVEALAADDPADLRRFFRREMFRLQADSICRESEVFVTLARTSDLADAAIAGAYRMAVEQVKAAHPPASAAYRPKDQMLVIALGRLGMREFDLASDADLVFVIPDRDAPEQLFWTRVAEQIISIITAYTGDGMMFAVDTRLRPNGRSGAMVQSESAYRDYLTHSAEAWEGITYMKSRATAGDIEGGTAFLHELQQVDWRRYGQSGRSRKQLLQMRLRLEKELGGDNPLKAGRGGYYDIDFALMYLRLKGAGIFFKVLNTPARIDVVEQMGHLERPDADFLRDAAGFYRALDHALRVASGHTEGDLPTAGWALENVSELLRRWTPDHLHDQPLDVELAQIQTRTREFFDRLFHI
jgi:glutamate-ammonia-ligase adenylyltransferase